MEGRWSLQLLSESSCLVCTASLWIRGGSLVHTSQSAQSHFQAFVLSHFPALARGGGYWSIGGRGRHLQYQIVAGCVVAAMGSFGILC